MAKLPVADRPHFAGCEGAWFSTPNWVMLSKGHTANEKLLLGYLYCRSGNENGRCFPSVPLMADDTGLHERTVQRLLRSLEEKARQGAGGLEVEHRTGERGDRSSVYRLIPPGAPVAICHPPGGGVPPPRWPIATPPGGNTPPPYSGSCNSSQSELGSGELDPSELGAPGHDEGRSSSPSSQDQTRARGESVAPVAAGDLAFLADGRMGVVISASTAEPAMAVPKAQSPKPKAEPAPAPPLPHAWPALRLAAAAAGVSEACARGEALREEVEERRPPVRVMAELLDMHPRVRERLKLPPIADPDGYLRGWRKRPQPEATYGEAKRALQRYGLTVRGDADPGPQPVGQLVGAARPGGGGA